MKRYQESKTVEKLRAEIADLQARLSQATREHDITKAYAIRQEIKAKGEELHDALEKRR